jgi:hypothetical protein
MQQQIRNESGNTVLALARLCLSHDKILAQLNADCLKSKAGSKTRLDYLRAIGKETREHIALIQSLGYFPKDLGIQTHTNYEFKAVIGLGSYDPKPVFVPQLPASFEED